MYCLFCVVLCTVCVYMCTVLLPPGGYPTAVKYITSYHLSTDYTVKRPEDRSLYEIVPSIDQHCFLPHSIFLPQKVL